MTPFAEAPRQDRVLAAREKWLATAFLVLAVWALVRACPNLVSGRFSD